MRIGYDVQALYTGSSTRGIGRYCHQFLSTLFRLYPDNEYVLFTNGLHDDKAPLPETKNVAYRMVDYLPGQGHNPVNGLLQYANYYAEDLDLMHILSPVEHSVESVMSRKPLAHKTICTLYDLIPLVYPLAYLPTPNLEREYSDRLQIYGKADLIVSISEWSRQDAIRLLHIEPDKIATIGIAPGETFRRLDEPGCEGVAHLRDKYDLNSSFILYVGSIDRGERQRPDSSVL